MHWSKCQIIIPFHFRFINKGIYLYDVTNLTTETKNKHPKQKPSSRAKVGAIEDKGETLKEDIITLDSCLEIVVKMENEVLATKVKMGICFKD